MSTLADEIVAIYGQLDPERQRALADEVRSLKAEQDADAAVRAHGALTMERVMAMTLDEVARYARDIGAPASAVVRVAERSGVDGS